MPPTMLGSTILFAPDASNLAKIADDLDGLDDYPRVGLERMVSIDFEEIARESGERWNRSEPVFFDEEGGAVLAGLTPGGVLAVLASEAAAQGPFSDDLARLAAFVREYGVEHLYELWCGELAEKRASSLAPETREVSLSLVFYALPGPTQARLRASLGGGAEPKPAFHLGPGDPMLVGIWLVGVVGVAVWLTIVLGSGPVSWFGGGLAILAVAGILACFAGFSNALRLARRHPFPGGVYVFARDVIVARGGTLLLLPGEALERIEVAHNEIRVGPSSRYTSSSVNLVYSGGQRVPVIVHDKARTEALVELLERSRGADAPGRTSANDVFHDARGTEAWGRPSPPVSGGSAPSRPVLARCAAAGLVIALPMIHASNQAHDEARFTHLKANPRVADCESYLEGNGAHRDEVRERWLPEAAFMAAKGAPGPDDLDAFAVAYPASLRATEARELAAKRRADRADRAAKGPTVTPMQQLEADIKLAEALSHATVEPAPGAAAKQP